MATQTVSVQQDIRAQRRAAAERFRREMTARSKNACRNWAAAFLISCSSKTSAT